MMWCERTGRAAGAWVLAGLIAGGCGGGDGGAAAVANGSTAVAVELAYTDAGSPRAAGLAAALAAAAPDRDRASVATVPDRTWLRLTVEGPDFAAIVCQFPRTTGGRCDGIPAGNGRTVTVEEWDEAFDTLYFRGRATGVRVEAGRDTRVSVRMRPPVAIRYPAEDAALNRRTFDVLVQTESGATVQLFVGPHSVGHAVADANGVAVLPVVSAGSGSATPADASDGLADGEYLLTAVAYPGPTPAAASVRHLGAPVSFEVDLQPPALHLSAPTVTSNQTVDVEGVTEPGAAVRCGKGDPAAGDQPDVLADGRFHLPAITLDQPVTNVACVAIDRAGNRAGQTLTVARMPTGFAIDARLPAITSRPQAPLEVRTDPTVEDLLIEVTGTDGTAPLTKIALNTSSTGVFSVLLDLRLNQWNQVRVTARLAAIPLGEAVLNVEHDDIPPAPPVQEWYVLDPAAAYFDAGTGYLNRVRWGFKPLEAGARLELYRANLMDFVALPNGEAVAVPEKLVLSVDGAAGYFDVPSGYCSFEFPVVARDRAGNRSALINFGLYPVTDYCVR